MHTYCDLGLESAARPQDSDPLAFCMVGCLVLPAGSYNALCLLYVDIYMNIFVYKIYIYIYMYVSSTKLWYGCRLSLEGPCIHYKAAWCLGLVVDARMRDVKSY